MSRVSDSLQWGIRWETVERVDGTLLYGALMPETYPSLRAAQRAERPRLSPGVLLSMGW